MNFAKIWLSIRANGCVRFERYYGKMYSRHLFAAYGGLFLLAFVNVMDCITGGVLEYKKVGMLVENFEIDP